MIRTIQYNMMIGCCLIFIIASAEAQQSHTPTKETKFNNPNVVSLDILEQEIEDFSSSWREVSKEQSLTKVSSRNIELRTTLDSSCAAHYRGHKEIPEGAKEKCTELRRTLDKVTRSLRDVRDLKQRRD